MPETVVLKVGMSCKGCVGAVERVLNKLEGVEKFDIDLEQQKVTVTGDVTPAVVLEKVSKTGKPTQIWPEQAVPEPAEAAPAKPASEIAA